MGNDIPPAKPVQEKYLVPGLERGLMLLSEFTRDTPALTAPQLAKRLDVPRATVYRLLMTLENLGFVKRSETGHEYRLGLGVLRLGFEYVASLDITELGQPILHRLAELINYPCNIAVLDERSVVYIARALPPTSLTSAMSIGARLPAHATVVGRILLQDKSLAQLQTLYPEDPLEAYSPDTPGNAAQLYELLQRDKQQSYVMGEGYFEPAFSSVAAPVRSRSGEIIAVLGVMVPSAHIDRERLDTIVQSVCLSAAELTQLMRYQN
ncbi:MAG TPA: IclR family transcriptional regulator [Pseudomonas sp.]